MSYQKFRRYLYGSCFLINMALVGVSLKRENYTWAVLNGVMAVVCLLVATRPGEEDSRG